jgi:hypothetical protein
MSAGEEFPHIFRRVSEADVTFATAQKRLGQVSGHLAGSKSGITPTEGDSARAALLQKNPDDVSLPSFSHSTRAFD